MTFNAFSHVKQMQKVFSLENCQHFRCRDSHSFSKHAPPKLDKCQLRSDVIQLQCETQFGFTLLL